MKVALRKGGFEFISVGSESQAWFEIEGIMHLTNPRKRHQGKQESQGLWGGLPGKCG